MICYGKSVAVPTKSAYEFAFKTARFSPVQNEKVKTFPWYKMLI